MAEENPKILTCNNCHCTFSENADMLVCPHCGCKEGSLASENQDLRPTCCELCGGHLIFQEGTFLCIKCGHDYYEMISAF